MRDFELVSHTADIGIKVTADSLPELFRGALEGMAHVQKDSIPGRGEAHTESIQLTAPDLTALLVDFLSDVHTLSDIHNVLYVDLEIDTLNESELKGKIKGFKTDSFDEDIKAVTHSQAEVLKNEEGNLETIIIFDL